ncbi:MAG TPA: hypothetical protein VJU14_04630 [Solirubrobacterales bacterium]|nr:hypothetical protein [Solirubrobacterales bacterium]
MTRLQALVPALAIAALLAAAPAATAATTPVASPANVDIEFDPPANHGLSAHVENHREEIMLVVERKARSVEYVVPGEVTETGLKAQFGKLGVIEVAFTPTKTRRVKPPKECKGEPSTLSEGLFVGTIRFRGERDYVRIEATRAEGTMEISREPEWRCSSDDKPVPPPSAQPSSTLIPSERAKPKREQASLFVAKGGCACFFAAFTGRSEIEGDVDEFVAFIGVKIEEREKMEITRGLSVLARPSRFVFDHDAGTARIDPPRPFTGTATYKRRPDRDLWRSTLRVPLLGAPPLHIRGRKVIASLVREPPGR